MVAASDQPSQEGLPEYSWIAKLGEAKKTKREEKPGISIEDSIEQTYVLRGGNEIAKSIREIFEGKEVVDINSGKELKKEKLDELLNKIDDPNVIYPCYGNEMGKIDYRSPDGVFYVGRGNISLGGGYNVQKLSPNTLYIIAKREGSSYHIITIPGEIPLADILELERKHKLERGKIVVVRCDPPCEDPNKLESLPGFVYVDRNKHVEICSSPVYINVEFTRFSTSRNEKETEGYQP